MALHRGQRGAQQLGIGERRPGGEVLLRVQAEADAVGHAPDRWFSFRGEESDFLECVPFGDGPNQWQTSPGDGSPVVEYDEAYRIRGACALGRSCAP